MPPSVFPVKDVMPIFRPPTYPVAYPQGPTISQLWRYYTYDQGAAVVIADDTASTVMYPYQGDLEDYDRYYLGGYEHEIDSDEATFLTAQGYGEFIEE